MAKKPKDPEMKEENTEMAMDHNDNPEVAEYLAELNGSHAGDEVIAGESESAEGGEPGDISSAPQTGSEYHLEDQTPQTGSEDRLIPEDLNDRPDSSSLPQTGSFSTPDEPEEIQNPSESDSAGSSTPESESVPDSEPETPRPKPRATRRKTSAAGDDSAPEAEAGAPQTDSAQSQTNSGETAAPRGRRRRAEPIVSIDERRSVESDADKLRNDLLDLVESLKGRKVLTDTIQGVERSADNPNISFAVVYHGGFKVIIPADETVEAPTDFRDRLPGDVMHYLVTKRLGAEIDYIVKGVDEKSGIAAASRLEAMASKRKEYYFGTDRDGNNLLYEGITAEARIVSVIRAGIFVDIFGVESYIPLRELSYQRWIDASQHYQPGQRVLVKLLSIDRTNRSKIIVQASVKQAGENPYEKALRRYSVGSRYVGTVSIVDTNGVFVSLDGGIDCLCSYPKRGRPPRGSRVTVRILGINNETNRIWGAITHMTGPR